MLRKIVRHLRKKLGRGGKKPSAAATPPPLPVARAPVPRPSAPPPPRRPRPELRGGPRSSAHPAAASSGAHPRAAPLPRSAATPRAAAGGPPFGAFDLPAEMRRAVAALGFTHTTPIQAAVLPLTLAGRHVAGRAQTGTGKTAAFLITIFTHCLRHPPAGPRKPGRPRALVIAPTRELIMQIERDAQDLGRDAGFRTVAVFGGTEMRKQEAALRAGPMDLLVATPGRLLDFYSRRMVDLKGVEILVLDEADRMLDMGFIPDVRRIVGATPPKEERQTLLFSATLSPEVMRLASNWMIAPARVDVAPEQVAVDTVNQLVYIVTARQKFTLLCNLLQREKLERVMLFVNRRTTADRLDHHLREQGFASALISGALPQERRAKTLEAFRAGTVRLLVATDVAGRGLHIDGVSHVINYNIPLDPEDYVHRIGRTGRAGAAGTSVTFACEEESFYLPDVEKYIGRALKCTVPPEELLQPLPRPVELVEEPRRSLPPGGRRPFGGRGGPRRGGGGRGRR